MDHKAIRCENVDLIQITGHRVQWRNFVNTAMNIRVP